MNREKAAAEGGARCRRHLLRITQKIRRTAFVLLVGVLAWIIITVVREHTHGWWWTTMTAWVLGSVYGVIIWSVDVRGDHHTERGQ